MNYFPGLRSVLNFGLPQLDVVIEKGSYEIRVKNRVK